MSNPLMELAEAHDFRPFWVGREKAVLELTNRALEYFASRDEYSGLRSPWVTTLNLLDANMWEEAANEIMEDIGVDLGCSSTTGFIRRCLAELLEQMSARAIVWRRERLAARREDCERELARLDKQLAQSNEPEEAEGE